MIKRIARTAFLLALPASILVVICGCQKPAAPGANTTAKTTIEATNINDVSVGRGDISQQVPVTGDLAALDKTLLSSKQTGRIISLPFREGDHVNAGDVFAQLDPTEARATLNQYVANVQNLNIKLAQAVVQYNQTVTNSQLAVKNAKSQLDAAVTSLQKTQSGGRPEEKEEARHQVDIQQANLDNALSAYNREVELYNAGAVAKADLENAETTYKTAVSELKYYKQNYELVQKGRPEDIANAQQSVRQYQIAYENAVANLANAKVSRESIASYQAQLVQAKQQVAQYRQQLADLSIMTPIDGYVASRAVTLGQTVAAGSSVAEIDNVHTTYFEPNISETDYRKVHPGQHVNIAIDAYPGRTFSGTVATIYPSALSDTRQFTFRVTVPNPGNILRPGMYARGLVTTAVHHNVVLVPLTTLLSRDSSDSGAIGSYGVATGSVNATPQKVMLVGPNNKAVSRNVEVGFRDATYAEITSGLRGGEELITKGQASLRDGDPVKPFAAGDAR